jgi:3-phenylpropionate/trans-cinnamate dioxygenase ferredoxin subunit
MPATVVVTPVERPVMGYALSRVVAFYAKGTTEQRESAASLAQMLAGLEATPEGAVEMEVLRQDAYLLGIRLFYTSVELEESWLDARDRAEGREVEPADPELERTVAKYFPELVRDPIAWNFDRVRGLFTDLGIKIDRTVTELAPRARGMYNSDREEMSDRATEIREENARRRLTAAEATQASAGGGAAVATAERPPVMALGWGVEFATGLSPDDIPAESFRVLSVGSVRVLITNFGGQLAAVDGNCTHQRATLTKAHVEGTAIECPRHGATFDLRTGEQLCPPFCQKWMDHHGMVGKLIAMATPNKKDGDLPRYPLRIENGEIVLRV